MKTNSNAYRELKRNHQNDMDFLLLICHAVPALNAYIKAVQKGSAPKLPDPDHFEVPQPATRLEALMPRYRKVVGRMLFLASFSYFEAYFKDLLSELIAFHGGTDHWLSVARKRMNSKLTAPIETRKLRESAKPEFAMRYRKLIGELSDNPNFRFPSELLCCYGLYRLAHDSDEMRASQIEEFATTALGVPISQDRWVEFNSLRGKRNAIAHGRLKEMDLTTALNAAKFLFALAKDIDAYTVANLMILEDV